MTTKKGISEVVGHIRIADGSSDAVYRALRPLLCASCGRLVAEGEMFTRRKLPGEHLRLMPQCTECAPVALHTTGGKIRSTLIEALLSPAPETPLTRAPAAVNPLTDEAARAREKREAAAREVQRRIGPALKRRRQ